MVVGSGDQDPLASQVEVGTARHLSFEGLDPVDVAFDGSGSVAQRQAVADGQVVAAEVAYEGCQCGEGILFDGLDPVDRSVYSAKTSRSAQAPHTYATRPACSNVLNRRGQRAPSRRSGTPSKRSRRTQMDCYLVLRRSSSSTGHADVTASRSHAATSNAVVGNTGLSSVRDASLDGTTHCCQSGGTHEPRSTSPVRSSPRRLGRADAIHSADAISETARRGPPVVHRIPCGDLAIPHVEGRSRSAPHHQQQTRKASRF